MRRIPDERLVPFAREVRHSISRLYTGSAADYANRLPDGTIENPPSLAHVGSGEGAQAFGWGLYASTVRGVAEGYAERDRRDKLFGRTHGGVMGLGGYSRKPPLAYTVEYTGGEQMPEYVRETLEYSGMTSVDDIISAREESILVESDDPDNDIAHDPVIGWLKRHRDEITIVQPKVSKNVYEQTFFTDRAPGDESHLLNWYEPVSEEQMGWILKQAEKEGLVEKFEKENKWNRFDGNFERFITDNGLSADAIYEQLSKSGLAHSDNKYRDTSEFLARAGIDGIKYPVATTHGAPKEGDGVQFNYVSFLDDNIRVDHKWTDGQQRYSVTRDWSYTPSDPQREYDEVVARYTNPDGTRKPGWMKAPNGRPTNLAERQWVQVRTPAFKAWFGDWENDPADASKVVDENGEPLVVYHATDNAFTVFDRSHLGENTDYNAYDEAAKRMSRLGFWFNESDLRKRTNTKLSVSAYADIKNPYETTFDELWNAMSETSHEEFIEDLNMEGYDGITLEDSEFGGKSFVLLEPTQIKSATENTGAFDAANPDIRFSVRLAPELRETLTLEPSDEATAKASVKAWRAERKAFTNRRNGRTAELKADWTKIFSEPAKKKSANYAAHYAAANHLDTLFENGVRMWDEPPRNGSQDIRAYAKYGCPFEFGGETYLAKITVKEYADGKATDGFYSIEAISVEKISAGGINAGITSIEGHELDPGATAVLKNMLQQTPDIVAQSAPSAQAPTPDAFVRDAVMGMLVAAGDGQGAADADAKPTERASVRRGGSPVRIDDLAVGTLAQRILAGKDPTVDDARKFLDGFGLSRTLDAGAALRAAREIAEANRERLKGEVERAIETGDRILGRDCAGLQVITTLFWIITY